MRAKTEKPLHRQLQALLNKRWRAGDFDQTSLARAVAKDQTTVGLYLTENEEKAKRAGKVKQAGPLDLDEAASALRHISSSLSEFLAGVEPPPPSPVERLARRLYGRHELHELIEDLLLVPKQKQPGVIELIRNLSRVTKRKRAGEKSESTDEHTPAPHTRSARGKRR